MEENTSNENRKKSGLLWILIALLAITNGVTFWMYMQEKNKASNEIIVKEQIIIAHKKQPDIQNSIKATTSRIPKGLMGHDAPKEGIKQIY